MSYNHPRSGALDCELAREQLSARLDGEPGDARALDAHVATCARCRAYECALAGFAPGFAALRESTPLPDLWQRIEQRSRPRSYVTIRSRIAAALIGFVGFGGAILFVERTGTAATPERHFFEPLAARELGPDALFASLPEYRLLRALPAHEESR